MILEHRRDELATLLGEAPESLAEYESILTAVRNMPLRSETDPARVAERQREKEVIKRRLATLTEANPSVRDFIEDTVRRCNGTPGQPESFDLLACPAQAQAYRLCHWRVASEEINYRRFFDINELAALSMEKPEVFAATHGLIFACSARARCTGCASIIPMDSTIRSSICTACSSTMSWEWRTGSVRPTRRSGALPRMSERSSARPWPSPADGGGCRDRPLYIVVEKILGAYETLPEDWPVYGTSGYDFLHLLNGLFVDADTAGLDASLSQLDPGPASLADVVYSAKHLIMQHRSPVKCICWRTTSTAWRSSTAAREILRSTVCGGRSSRSLPVFRCIALTLPAMPCTRTTGAMCNRQYLRRSAAIPP